MEDVLPRGTQEFLNFDFKTVKTSLVDFYVQSGSIPEASFFFHYLKKKRKKK